MASVRQGALAGGGGFVLAPPSQLRLRSFVPPCSELTSLSGVATPLLGAAGFEVHATTRKKLSAVPAASALQPAQSAVDGSPRRAVAAMNLRDSPAIQVTLKSRHAKVMAWQEEVTAGSQSAYSSRRSTGLPIESPDTLDREGKQPPTLSAEERKIADAKAIKMSGAEAAKREQQKKFKSQWSHTLSGWAYKKQQRRCVPSRPVAVLLRARIPRLVRSL